MRLLPGSSNVVTDKYYQEGLYFLQFMCSARCYHGNASRLKQGLKDTYTSAVNAKVTH